MLNALRGSLCHEVMNVNLGTGKYFPQHRLLEAMLLFVLKVRIYRSHEFLGSWVSTHIFKVNGNSSLWFFKKISFFLQNEMLKWTCCVDECIPSSFSFKGRKFLFDDFPRISFDSASRTWLRDLQFARLTAFMSLWTLWAPQRTAMFLFLLHWVLEIWGVFATNKEGLCSCILSAFRFRTRKRAGWGQFICTTLTPRAAPGTQQTPNKYLHADWMCLPSDVLHTRN